MLESSVGFRRKYPDQGFFGGRTVCDWTSRIWSQVANDATVAEHVTGSGQEGLRFRFAEADGAHEQEVGRAGVGDKVVKLLSGTDKLVCNALIRISESL